VADSSKSVFSLASAPAAVRSNGDRHCDCVLLADVSQVRAPLDRDLTLADHAGSRRDLPAAGLLHLVEQVLHVLQRLADEVVEPSPARLDVVPPQVGRQHPERREGARGVGHDHSGHSGLRGDVDDVHGAGAARCDQPEVPRVESALGGDGAHGVGHGGVERCVPVFESFSRRTLRLGSAGTGSATKVVVRPLDDR
jgi:hypothetical protein